MKKRHTRYHVRSKTNYQTAKAAWRSIADATGLTPRQVVKGAHTRTHWRWKTKK